MIESQSNRQISLFEAVLNNYSTLQRCLLLICALLVVVAVLCVEQSNIASFLFSNLPLGIGLTNSFIAPLVAIVLLAISCTAYFGIICTDKLSPSSRQETNVSGFLSELRLTLVFGACFGLLTAILCSLIFVIAEPHLPQAFLQYHQIFSSLDLILIALTALLTSALYLSVFMLPLSSLLSRLMVFETKPSKVKLTTNAIIISSIILSFFMALSVALVTSTFSINLIVFIVIISAITASALGLLYWFVGLEASLIANLVYCLLVSYLAHIFL
ncbi:hypothetical protein FR932_04430 [Moritella marina ATCC 15381]|uniref:Uncharacterized protein n=1 Tax=Moritella marina ATCC 15381 TaxID=1202962 RepID=A0A5J6WIP5_MORMI|nr:hypothetical protein [Moritella marina]QFI37128.1 hypothetical protein FR932_04430 [Moritella marina ATCC 15381]